MTQSQVYSILLTDMWFFYDWIQLGREFYFESYEEKITTWFGFEGDVAVSIAFFLNQTPSIGFEAFKTTASGCIYYLNLG